MLVLQDVPWEDYEQLLDHVGSRRPGLRMTYDQGRLEVVSPLRKHLPHPIKIQNKEIEP
jgi:hypothetical protein